jgi:hypothetical protein
MAGNETFRDHSKVVGSAMIRISRALALSVAMAFPTWVVAQTRTWPSVGSWTVVSLPGERSPVCTAVALPQQGNGFTYLAAFAFSTTTTHFYMQFDGSALPAPPTDITLLADAVLILTAPIEKVASAAGNRVAFRIDLPGSTLAQTVVPKLLGAENLTVHFGQTTLSVPSRKFGLVYDELSDCAKSVTGDAGQKRRP